MKSKILIGIALALCAGACVSSSPARFYMLNAIQETAPAGAVEAAQNPVSIRVGPVLIPDYLDRTPLCVRDSGHEVTYAEFHRWAEPLDAGIARVLVENLSLLLNTARIDVFPWQTPAPADFQVRIMLIRFDGEPGGQAELKAHWSLSAAGQEKPVFETMTSIVEPVESCTYEALVKAQNKALEKLGREIAGAIQQAAAGR